MAAKRKNEDIDQDGGSAKRLDSSDGGHDDAQGQATNQSLSSSSFGAIAASVAYAPADTTKELGCGADSLEGVRDSNEDCEVLDESLGVFGQYFAVFDGHAGRKCAEFLASTLHRTIASKLTEKMTEAQMAANSSVIDDLSKQKDHFKQQRALVDQQISAATVAHQQAVAQAMSPQQPGTPIAPPPPPLDTSALQQLRHELTSAISASLKSINSIITDGFAVTDPGFVRPMKSAITDAFVSADNEYLELAKQKKVDDGSTAVVAIVQQYASAVQVVLAHCGDSRAVLCRDGRGVRLTEDHKPNRRDEEKRIKLAGGNVVNVAGIWRACGAERLDKKSVTQLSLSRSFGDRSLKVPPVVIATPEVQVVDVKESEWFIILACDGLWDVMSDQEAVDLVLAHLEDPKAAARALSHKAIDKGSQDNVTVVVVTFPWNLAHAAEVLETRAASKAISLDDDDDDMFTKKF